VEVILFTGQWADLRLEEPSTFVFDAVMQHGGR
jgi:hypothetical protein